MGFSLKKNTRTNHAGRFEGTDESCGPLSARREPLAALASKPAGVRRTPCALADPWPTPEFDEALPNTSTARGPDDSDQFGAKLRVC